VDCRLYKGIFEKGDMTTSDIIKQGVVFRQKEFLLSLCVFAYMLVSFSVLSLTLSDGYMLLLQMFFILIENYITVAVYYGIKQYLFEGEFDIPGMFVKAKHFFSRVLSYKLFAGLVALLLFAFCLSMIDVVKDSSVAAAGFITGFTVLWISFPVYLLMLTLFAPLIIIVEDAFLFPSVRKSVIFIRVNLPEMVKLVLVTAPLWIFALFLMRV